MKMWKNTDDIKKGSLKYCFIFTKKFSFNTIKIFFQKVYIFLNPET